MQLAKIGNAKNIDDLVSNLYSTAYPPAAQQFEDAKAQLLAWNPALSDFKNIPGDYVVIAPNAQSAPASNPGAAGNDTLRMNDEPLLLLLRDAVHYVGVTSQEIHESVSKSLQSTLKSAALKSFLKLKLPGVTALGAAITSRETEVNASSTESAQALRLLNNDLQSLIQALTQ